ncbi:MAG: hypothetical protein PHW13_00015 [Methylococcales bacterium]|nr:hypothetical protein [Methylococcales bacterium]
MPHQLPFPIQNFEAYCSGLLRVGIDPGFVMYTNDHAGSHHPVARLLSRELLDHAHAYIASPSDEGFKRLVEGGVLLDTEWDRITNQWQIISFEGWEALHAAFNRLHGKSRQALTELGGVEPDFNVLA